ncbi:hypothetical protein GCM10010317_087200 [Streptomyces mirabilis]|nr:hypothetical protein GCM10010317_087200 [Streptomyces mirabilis]
MATLVGGKGNVVVFRGVLALIAGSAFAVVAGGYRGADVWVWDWADVVFRRRTRYGTPWWSLTTMRIQFGIAGAVFLVLTEVVGEGHRTRCLRGLP